MIRFALVLSCFATASALSEDHHPLPSEGATKHMGVATCASSTCHGATQAFRDSNVNQNELSIWQNEDPHANTYKILLDPESERIARNLGIGKAHEADICLDCHADNVPGDARGEKFVITEGVGCEACHGGAENYLSSHATGGASHADNLEAGLYPTEDPSQRAELCLSCHQGNKDQMITHRIMGAGHPRLQFELDNFTWMHPHFEVDDDYFERKGAYDGAVNWGVGQGVAAATQLEVLLDDSAGWNGIFPELVLFDCHACHRSMFENQWVPRRSTGLGPGVVRYNDASLLMFRHVAAHIDPAATGKLAQQTRDLHGAMRVGRAETEQAARTLLDSIRDLVPRLEESTFDASAIRAMFQGLVRDAEQGEFRDYAAAEQAALAVDTVLIAFEDNGVISAEEGERLREEAGALYLATRSEDDYRQSEFVAALKKLSAAVP